MIKDWINIESEKEITALGDFKKVKKLINDDIKEILSQFTLNEKNTCEIVKITSRSKKGLVEKIKALKALGGVFSNEEELKKEDLKSKGKKTKGKKEDTNLENIPQKGEDGEVYFISKAHKIIFYLLEYEGEERMKKLKVYKSHYLNNDVAKKWYKDLAKIVHPDKCKIKGAKEAMEELASMYNSMVDNGR